MPNISLKPNKTDAEYFIEFDIEAVEAEHDEDEDGETDDTPAGLAVTVTYDGETLAEVFETQADEIRSFRDAVVAECDKALALLG